LQGTKQLEGKALKSNEFIFQLKDENGKVLSEAKNNKNGIFTFDTIHYTNEGQYHYIIEEKNTEEESITYDTSTYFIDVDVKDNGKGQLTVDTIYSKGQNKVNEITFKNIYTEIKEDNPKAKSLDEVILTINKLDDNNKTVAGAHLQILDSKGNVVEEFTTTNEAYVLKGKLSYNETYTLHEVNPPLGYEKAKDQTFVANQSSITVTMIDKVIKQSKTAPDLVLYKTDQNENFLTGATFRLVGEGRDETLSTDAKFTFKGLADGHYTITETVVPEGYEGIDSFEIDVYNGNIYYEYEKIGSLDIINTNDGSEPMVAVLGDEVMGDMEADYEEWYEENVEKEVGIEKKESRISKNTTDTTTKTNTKSKTSDKTNILGFLSTMIIAILGLFLLRKKKSKK
jgi:pilin isopeptide linkage protein